MNRYRQAAIVLQLGLLTAAASWADGGTLVLRRQAGPSIISVFSSPEPLRVGVADVSVMVQQASDQSPILNANVKVRAAQARPDSIAEVIAPATHAQATNKLLYVGQLSLPSSGLWKLAVDVQTQTGRAEVTGELRVLPPQPPLLAYWPYVALVPALALLFVLNRWLKKRRGLTSLRVRR